MHIGAGALHLLRQSGQIDGFGPGSVGIELMYHGGVQVLGIILPDISRGGIKTLRHVIIIRVDGFHHPQGAVRADHHVVDLHVAHTVRGDLRRNIAGQLFQAGSVQIDAEQSGLIGLIFHHLTGEIVHIVFLAAGYVADEIYGRSVAAGGADSLNVAPKLVIIRNIGNDGLGFLLAVAAAGQQAQ